MQTYAVWEPGSALEFREMTFADLESLVGGKHTAVARVSLWRDGKDAALLKLLASDVSMLFPDDYGRQHFTATRFVEQLGGPTQPWAGVIAVYGIDSQEGGFPQSLSEAQRTTIMAAYRAATGTST